jgi:hypothetical protein
MTDHTGQGAQGQKDEPEIAEKEPAAQISNDRGRVRSRRNLGEDVAGMVLPGMEEAHRIMKNRIIREDNFCSSSA